MTRPRKPARYTVIPHPDVTVDVAALATYGPELVAAAQVMPTTSRMDALSAKNSVSDTSAAT